MLFHKLRLLTVYGRTNVVQSTIRQTIQFPAIAQAVRAYARYVDDDDDDLSIAKTRVNRREPKGSSFSRYNRDDDDDFIQRRPRKSSFGDQKSRYGGFFERKFGFGGQRYNIDHPQFNRLQFGQSQFGRRQTRGEMFNAGLQKLSPIDFDHEELGEIKKDFYQPSEITKNRSNEEVAEYRRKNEIIVPSDAPKPIITFGELENLPPKLAIEIEKRKFEECTPIHAQGMLIVLSGKNMIGIAQTG